MSTYVIGDLHGCCDEFEVLLSRLDFQTGRDRLWLVGDLVNRGPRSLACLRLARDLDAQVVLGNHDLHLLAVAAGAQSLKRSDTLDEILDAPDRDQLLDWLRRRPLLVCEERSGQPLCMVHAGLPPQWSLDTARRLACEVEAVLRGPRWIEFMGRLYGNQPAGFDESLTGWERLRAIVNVFTRMRFITEGGVLDFAAKEGLDAAPPGFMAWFQYPREDNLRVLFGHWAALEGAVPDARIACEALDTGCVWGRSLTALDLESGKRIAVPTGSQGSSSTPLSESRR
ncbi:symmetrical bis(5'-nucleosyl)-tetraphosphatase [Halotalea alkalilenta]|uniref:bis(5'-nucleosyl)-tetraphosphatase (symmetrical) n=1 Tax=Halotalea alkalilenta TaxID=376489 RepID=A0A172YH66_9GAMM|nr:symmetrical bis(5'-nucleosyl)-tetraphosphatase [Halotalea alkalilenta]ANF58547.1 diadenosine tetraphosphatase [Halotalea alkalilenta]